MNYLITGGAGFFGRHMAAFLLALPQVDKVVIYSRGEYLQAKMREEVKNDRLRFLIGDVRDAVRLERAFQDIDVVIHAAALKRVEVGEYCPTEMVETNVNGTRNVIQAAQRAGVHKLVVLSSDKACSPLNAYGATKLVAEKLALAAHAEAPDSTQINVTRYGNVAGSTGSVIPTWRRQLAATGTIRVSDLAATRFWMSPSEAVDLVWYACNLAGGNLIVPTLKSYLLEDLALAMCPRGLEMNITGLSPGEKLHESMISDQEASGFSPVGEYWIKGQHAGMVTSSSFIGLHSCSAPKMRANELRERLGSI